MPDHKETNVRLPFCALEALAAIRARWGISRDAAVRRLLADHVEAQEQCEPEARLTHISTVLRYPPPPRRRRGPKEGGILRLRAPSDLLERARAVSLKLPGQYERAHRDYQGRMLTDAVMTAIAVAESFTDDFLNGLFPVLRHRAALELWLLATAESSTEPERDLLIEAMIIDARRKRRTQAPPLDDAQRRLCRAADLLAEEVAWHSPDRFQAVTRLAHRMLTEPGAEANEQLLYDQWEQCHPLFRQTIRTTAASPYARQAFSAPAPNRAGRGGAAVWRALRKTELEDFEEWLTDGRDADRAERVMGTPGWLLRRPAAWHARTSDLSAAGQLPGPLATWVAEGKVLAFPYKNRWAVWPLQRRPGQPHWEPVPSIEALTTAAAGLRPDQITGFIEAVLIDWNHESAEEATVPILLGLSADQAYAFGLITPQQQRTIVAQDRATTLKDMNAVIDAFKDGGLDDERLERLREARSNATEFRSLVMRFGKHARRRDGMYIGSEFTETQTTLPWPRQSVAGELLTATPAHLVQWLASTAHQRSRQLLDHSVQQAWQRASDQYRDHM
ncbi:hypothetical protein ACWEQL_39510 [Kitasatospora sp. NPDC004240]